MGKKPSTNINRSWDRQLKAAERFPKTSQTPVNTGNGRRPKEVRNRYRDNRDPLRLIGIAAVLALSAAGTYFIVKEVKSTTSEDTSCQALEDAVATIPADSPRYINVQSSILFPSKTDAAVGINSVFQYRIHTDADAVVTSKGCGLSIEVEAEVDRDRFAESALDGSAVTPQNFTVDYVFKAFNESDSSANIQACNNEISILSGTVNMNLETFAGAETQLVDSVEFVGSLGSALNCGANNG